MKEISLDHLMQALGWTLLHSVWQTALVALCLYVALAYAQKLNPNIRYVMAVVALLFTGALTTTTFLDLYFHHQPALEELQKDIYSRGVSAQHMPLTFVQPVTVGEQLTSLQFSELIQQCKMYVNLHLHWIVALWMTGVLALSLRFAGSLFYIHRLKKRWVNPVAERWQAKMQVMSKRLNIRQPIILLASGTAKVPMMIGHLKPVILIPAAMMSGLPEDQVEAVIAHEMAHIFRKDYWINMLQSLFEIIFFFHPAIWWISSVIREEREKCCDDLAIALCGSSLTYAKALASVEEVKLQHCQLALAMNGGKGSLFQRIERILEPGKSGGNQRARFVSASLAIVLVLLLGTSGDSIAYRYGEEKVAEALDWAKFIHPKVKKDTAIDLSINQNVDLHINTELEVDEDVDLDIDIDQDITESILDTLPKSQVEFSPAVIAARHLQDSLLAQAQLALAYAKASQANVFYFTDTFPKAAFTVPAYPHNPSAFNYSYIMDSTLRVLQAIDMDSLLKLAEVTTPLLPAQAQLDSIMAMLDINTQQGVYAFQYTQDTSIERRLQELEASMRAKEKEFEKLMQEQEKILQKLLSEKEMAWKEQEKAFNQHALEQEKLMEAQERIVEEQMRQQEEQMRKQEDIISEQEELMRQQEVKMDKQMREQEEILREQEEKMWRQEELMRQQESRFDEASQVLENLLKEDGFVKKGEKYTFEISRDGLYLNKEKLSDSYFQKYLKWIQDHEEFQLNEGSTLTITRTAE